MVRIGKNLIKTDYNLSEGLSKNKISKTIKEIVGRRFQGNQYQIGDTDLSATVNNRTKNELSFKQNKMSNKDFLKKGSMVGNYDELLENLSDVKEVKNLKPTTKPNVDHYLSGRVAVDLGDGEIYYPRIDIEVNKNGNMIGYDIADIKKGSALEPN